jgi:hypothetical protein
MPEVNGQQFPYTEEGIIQAERAELEQSAQAPQDAPISQDQPEEQPNVSEEEQGQYEQVILAAEDILYSEGDTKKYIDMVVGADGIDQGLATTSSMIITSLDERMKGTMQESVVFGAATVIVDMLVEVVESAGQEITEDDVLDANKLLVGKLVGVYGTDEQALNSMGVQNAGQLQQIGKAEADYWGGKNGNTQ